MNTKLLGKTSSLNKTNKTSKLINMKFKKDAFFVMLIPLFLLLCVFNITASESVVEEDSQSITNFENIILEKAEVILSPRTGGDHIKKAYFVRGTIRIKQTEDAQRKTAAVGIACFNGNEKSKKRYLKNWPGITFAKHIIEHGGDSLYSFCTKKFYYKETFLFDFKVFVSTDRKIYIDNNNGENYHLDLENLVVNNLIPGFISPIEEPEVPEEFIFTSPDIEKVWIESKEPYMNGYLKYNPGAGKWFKDIRLPDPLCSGYSFNGSNYSEKCKPPKEGSKKHKVLFTLKTLYHDGTISSWSLKHNPFISIPGAEDVYKNRFGYKNKKIGLNLIETGRVLLEFTDVDAASKIGRMALEYVNEELDPDKEITINYNGLNLKIPAGALNEELNIRVTNQYEEIPASKADVELIGPVYRLEPHGTVFNKDFTMQIAYDGSLVSEKNLEEKNIFIFYYDDILKKWKYLKRAALDKENNTITAKCNHFSFFSAGVLSLPTEPPQAKGINTKPVNVEEVDPLSGITVLRTPSPNSDGSAEISYPVKLPPGVTGFTPKVALNYNTEAQNGNAGTGWNLTVSRIEIDTKKKGVPKYDGTDTLMLDGEELVDTGDGDGVYRFMVEGAFWKAEKNDDDNSFTVYQPNGTKMYYGVDGGSRLYHPDNENKIFTWFISKIQDKFGNTIEYTYNSVDEDGDRVNLNLSSIKYGYDHVYSVNFTWTDRPDTRTSLRSTFIINNKHKLDNIEVKYADKVLRTYKLEYHIDYDVRLYLKDITEKDENEEEVNSHSFEYRNQTQYADLASGHRALFKQEVKWDDPFGSLAYLRFSMNARYDDYTIPCTLSDLIDINGDGLPDRICKARDQDKFTIYLNTGNGFVSAGTITVNGVMKNEALRQSNTIDLIDINGDGLPDRIGKDFGRHLLPGIKIDKDKFYIQLNTGILSFKDDITWYVANSWGGLRAGGTVGGGSSAYNPCTYQTTYTLLDLVDINGDGLPDRVRKDRKNEDEYRGEDMFFIRQNTGNGFADIVHIKFTGIMKDEALRQTYDSNTPGGHNIHDTIDLIDINGDGLPDRVGKNFDNILWSGPVIDGDKFYIRLNCGFKFKDYITWDSPDNWYGLRMHSEEKYSGDYSRHSITFTKSDLIDINGDGLPDRLYKDNEQDTYTVHLNTGNGFISIGAIKAAGTMSNLALRHSHSDSVNPPGSEGFSNNSDTINLIDIDGDGLPDRVGKNFDHNLLPDVEIDKDKFYIQQNNIDAKTPLIKITNNKLNSNISLEYEYTNVEKDKTGEQTNDFYMKKEVLAKVTVDNIYKTTTTLEYSDGYFDRLEKQLYSFENVKATTNIQETDTFYITEKKYAIKEEGKDEYEINDIFSRYYKGRLLTKTKYIKIGDADPILTGKTEYTYTEDVLFDTEKPVKFVYPSETKRYIYTDEGDEVGWMLTQTQYDIDSDGLVTLVTITNENDNNTTDDDIIETIDYAVAIDPSTWLNQPYCITQSDYYGAAISRKIIYYDNLAQGYITDGIITGEETWNNQGENPVTYYEHDTTGDVKEVTTPDGLKIKIHTSYLLEPDIYKQVQKTMPDELTDTESFDYLGRIAKAVDRYGDEIEYTYDTSDRVIEIKEQIKGEVKITKKFSYSTEESAQGNLFKAQAEYLDDSEDDYLKAQFYTDTLGRRVQIKTESEVDGEKYWTVSGALVRDNFGRVIEQGIVTKTDYTNDSLIDNSYASLEYSTSFEYDDFGRFCKAVSANEYEVYKSYDKRVEDGIIIFVETLTDIEERESRIYRDVLGREIKTQVKREDESFAATTFYYDLHGYGRVTEPTGGVGEKQTDSLGRIQWIKTPDAGRKEYFYNDKGLISSIIKYGKEEAGSRQIDIIYDSLSRISQINYPGTDNDISYTYYGTGEEIDKYAKSNIKTITKGDYYEVQYNFDQFWIQEVKTIEGSTYSTKYEYDVQGRINELVYPDGEVVKYNYNEGGFLKSIIGNDTYIDEIIYDEFGQRKLVKYGNSTEVSYTYTPETRLLDMMTTKDKDGNTVLNYNYDFDITGNLEELTNTVDGITKSVQEYSYDKLGRIKSAAGNYMDGFSTYERSYKFDDDNRMMYKNFKDGKRYDFSYLSDTHAISHINVTGDPGITDIDFEYDDFGNMINKQVFKDATLLEETEFTYDENDRMSGFDDGVISLSFKYDNRGQRIVKDCLDEVGVLKENRYVNGFYTISDGTPTKHISDGAYVFATLIQNNPDNIVFYSSNNIGSTVLLTNKDGSVVQEYLYSPYGEMWVEETPEAYKEITRLFTAQEFDSETGLYYMNARYYDPHIGIFMRPDPAMDGLNHYAYVSCNPIRYTDPTGLGPEDSNTETTNGDENAPKDKNKSTGNKGQSGDTSAEEGPDVESGDNNGDSDEEKLNEQDRKSLIALLQKHGKLRVNEDGTVTWEPKRSLFDFFFGPGPGLGDIHYVDLETGKITTVESPVQIARVCPLMVPAGGKALTLLKALGLTAAGAKIASEIVDKMGTTNTERWPGETIAKEKARLDKAAPKPGDSFQPKHPMKDNEPKHPIAFWTMKLASDLFSYWQ